MADKDLVTLGVVKALLEMQANAFKESFRLMFDDVKEELRNVKKDLVDLKESLSFSFEIPEICRCKVYFHIIFHISYFKHIYTG